MEYYRRACELREQTTADRRYFHANAEVGLDMPKSKAYVMKKLKEYGLEPQECGYGVSATVGKGGKVLLLRADMDALPIPEESGEEFACPSGDKAHACGHDFHAAMLLSAARMLKENEDQLQGTVKFMFQPAEETFEGSCNMIENGILENPKVDAALAYHVAPGQMPVGIFMYNDTGTMMNSVDGFRITIKGKGGHGAYPNLSIDPINIAVHVYLALEAVLAREVDPAATCVMTIGKFEAGSAANIIPDQAVLEGTIRSNNSDERTRMVERMKELAIQIAGNYGGSAEITMLSQVPVLLCDGKLTREMVSYMKELPIEGLTPYPGIAGNASEDFACIAEKVPSCFMYLSAGFLDERGQYSAHNPKVRFNEDVIPIGSACLAHCATRWLASCND